VTTIRTPATVDEAVDRLQDIDRLLMVKGWERALILATIVRLGESRGRGIGNDGSVISPVTFAERGIPGLQHAPTVRLYVQRWLDANDGQYPEADQEYVLPTSPWPPVDKADAGSRATPTNIGKQLEKNPALRAAAIKAIAEDHTDEYLAPIRQGGDLREMAADAVVEAFSADAEKAGPAPFDYPPPGPSDDVVELSRLLRLAEARTDDVVEWFKHNPDVHVESDQMQRARERIVRAWVGLAARFTTAPAAVEDEV
jgi:hypothetical protein